jgi:hypothetical protein
MAMKKVTSSGSDRGAKMKADAAQKKSQTKTASQRKTSPQKSNSMGEQLMSKKEYNSRSGDLSGYGFNAVGRTLQRSQDQSKRADKKDVAAQAKNSRVNRAVGASRIKVGKTKK